MTSLNRRSFIAAGAAGLAGTALAQQPGHEQHGGHYERLNQPGRIGKPELAASQNVFDSPAPKATSPGRWSTKALLPLPRSEMAWAAAYEDRMHIVGGYGEQRTDRAYHHVYDPKVDKWSDGAPLPQGANHVGVGFLDGKLYAIGGRVDGRYSDNLAANESYEPGTQRWQARQPLPTARSGVAAAVLDDKIYVFGGEAPSGTFNQVEAYDPSTDRWRQHAPMPTARHGLGAVALGGRIYVISGGPTPGGSASSRNEIFTP